MSLTAHEKPSETVDGNSKEMPTMTYPLIIDSDPGIGDAVTILSALLDTEIDLLAVTSVAGRVSVDQATRNIQSVIALLDPPKWPRIGHGAGDPPLLPPDSGLFAHDLDGPGGLGSFQAYDVEMADPTEADKLMVDLVRSAPNEITLVTLGPLTNVQRALGRDPEFLTQLRGLICLGGSVTAGGDVTATAEFNLFSDPESARTVLTMPATTTLVPLDVVSRVQFTLDQFDRLKLDEHTRRGRLLGSLLPYFFRAHHEKLGRESVCLGELAALAAVTSPRFFERERMRIDVETSGELTRGMAVLDRRGVAPYEANIDILTEIDAQGVIDRFAHVMRNERCS